ncbi:hypothetical protein ACFLVE_01755, partial [Chloroflexota bacterium]
MKRIRIIGSIVLTALLLVGMLAFTPGSVSADDSDIIFEHPPLDIGEYPEAYTSDAGMGYLCLEYFPGLTSGIYDIRWYGLSCLGGGGGEDVSPDGMQFEIIFYQDDGGSPGAVVEPPFSDISPVVEEYYNYIGPGVPHQVHRFDVYGLNIPVSLTEGGWVSIR